MDQIALKGNTFIAVLFGFLMLIFSASIVADPPDQTGRISYINGNVSFLPAGETQWEAAPLNRPLVTNDELWTDQGSYAEIQLSGADIRLGKQTYLSILTLNDQMAQFQLTQGTLILSIKGINNVKSYEVDTPNLALSITEPGYYRIDVDPQNNTATLSIRAGEGTIYGENASTRIESGQSCSVTSRNLDNFDCVAMGSSDDFDAWSLARDDRFSSINTQYLSPDTIGYEDLYTYGTWSEEDQYGTVWSPDSVGPDWAPYQSGQWIWLSQWGWTWLDNQPWGFAPFHYGRWAHIKNRWCWVPGSINEHPVYAPALAVFIGGQHSRLELKGEGALIGWFPLAPGEVFIPSYPVSEAYFRAVNRGNTIINEDYLRDIYQNQNKKIHYVNAEIANAVTVLSVKNFAGSKLVNNLRLSIPDQAFLHEPKTHVAAVLPQAVSVFGNPIQYPLKIKTRNIIVKTPPPLAAPSFTQEQNFIVKNGGRPLSSAEIQSIKSENTKAYKVYKENIPGTNAPKSITQPPEIIPLPVIHKPTRIQPQSLPKVNPVHPLQNAPGVQSAPGAKPESNPQILPNGYPAQKINPALKYHYGTKVYPGSNLPYVPKVQPVPNKLYAPKVQPAPNIQYAPKVQPAPNIQYAPKVRPVPNIQNPPKVQPAPNIQYAPKVRPVPNIQNPPKVQPAPNIQYTPKVQPAPNIQYVPKAQPVPNIQYAPKLQPAPSAPNYHSAPIIHTAPINSPPPMMQYQPKFNKPIQVPQHLIQQK